MACRLMHEEASLLPTESSEGDFPSDIFRLHHYKTKSLQDTMTKLLRNGASPLSAHAFGEPICCAQPRGQQLQAAPRRCPPQRAEVSHALSSAGCGTPRPG